MFWFGGSERSQGQPDLAMGRWIVHHCNDLDSCRPQLAHQADEAWIGDGQENDQDAASGNLSQACMNFAGDRLFLVGLNFGEEFVDLIDTLGTACAIGTIFEGWKLHQSALMHQVFRQIGGVSTHGF